MTDSQKTTFKALGKTPRSRADLLERTGLTESILYRALRGLRTAKLAKKIGDKRAAKWVRK